MILVAPVMYRYWPLGEVINKNYASHRFAIRRIICLLLHLEANNDTLFRAKRDIARVHASCLTTLPIEQSRLSAKSLTFFNLKICR